jgi:hypothetical protein
VPRVEREEFVNIGILLYCKHEDYLNVKFVIDEYKIRALLPTIDLEVIHSYIDEIKDAVNNECMTPFIKKLDVPSKFRWLSAKKSTMIQYSPIHVGKSDDLDKTLEDLAKLMIL